MSASEVADEVSAEVTYSIMCRTVHGGTHLWTWRSGRGPGAAQEEAGGARWLPPCRLLACSAVTAAACTPHPHRPVTSHHLPSELLERLTSDPTHISNDPLSQQRCFNVLLVSSCEPSRSKTPGWGWCCQTSIHTTDRD